MTRKGVIVTKEEIKQKIMAFMQTNDIAEDNWEQGFTESETEPILRDLTDILHTFGGVYEQMYLVMVWGTFDEWCFFGGDADLYLSLYNGEDEPKFYNVAIPFLEKGQLEAFVNDVIAIAEGRKEPENVHLQHAMTWSHNAFVESVYVGHGEVGPS